ncbi:MAG: tRNA preQ1(34) S-adenosylmethionine ribosyltransferase-isomerase QueA [Rhodospirillales bacterium]|nr:tRNA preQ1(34) S-adenosylmethionine ribosyltransferase-isomerase QueA [Rhodospirillales bacterium]
MKVDDFDFELPRDLIAQHPVEPRDAARLLVAGRDGAMDHRIFRDLPDLLRPGDLLVVNDTRVIPARLIGRKGEGRIELTLVSPTGDGDWKALARPARRLSDGTRIDIAPGFSAVVTSRGDMGDITLSFETGDDDLTTLLDTHGAMPLPPYIERRRSPPGQDPEQDPEQDHGRDDRTDYQTVYATEPGAVAAPTAGLHFTDALFGRLGDAGIGCATVTLHVGLGTFQPVRVEDTDDHVMHAEWGRIDRRTAERINRARAAGGRIVAVGTTSTRLLESAATGDGTIAPFEGETDIFITPGYRFRAVDLMITNFHLPRSTLVMLVSAFAGQETIRSLYRSAVAEKYRFYSYGDACLLTHACSHMPVRRPSRRRWRRKW